MRTPSVLVTGANGEIGHGLITQLAQTGRSIVTLDIAPLEPALARLVRREFTGSIIDKRRCSSASSPEFEVDLVFHLAALLSTRSEFTPITAHQVNVEGTLNLLEFAQHEGESHGRPVIFLYPSSIAAYGLPDLDDQGARRPGAARTNATRRRTMYGCNKLYCEHLGRYYAKFYKQLAADPHAGRVDFRCVRFPGLISALTVPSGGTSDYAPEMIHAAAQGRALCLLRAAGHAHSVHGHARRDRRAADAGGGAARDADADRLQPVGVQPDSAGDPRRRGPARFPTREITWETDIKRQAHRRLVARRRGRRGRAPRLGLRAALRLRARVSTTT